MTSPSSRPSWFVALCVLGAMVCGAGIATQARINGELSLRIGDGVLAALISFGTGLIIVSIVMLAVRSGRIGFAKVRTAVADRSIPWWYVVGGVAGAFLVLSQGLVAAILGVALFSVGVVAGQTLSGLLIDRQGLGSMGAKPITVARVIGAVLALAAVIFSGANQSHGDAPLWMIALPFIAGLGIAWQQAVNGQVREVSGSAITATFINFLVGTTVLLVATLVHLTWAGLPTEFPTDPIVYLGGVVGVVFIAGGAIIVRFLGVLLLSLGTIAGQLIASLILDIVIPAKGHELALTTVIGTLLTLVAVIITAAPRRAASGTAPG